MNETQPRRYPNTLIFAILGVLAGIGLIVVATITETANRGLPPNIPDMVQVHSQTVLLWIMDSTPLVLGILAGFVGYRQDNLQHITNQLENQLHQEEKLRKELNSLTEELEHRVEERTIEVERRSQYIEAAAEVGRAATSIYKLDELLPRVVDQVSAKFGFYQAGIFIIDDKKEFAVMRAASSEGGKRMLARNHKLKVGEQGIVGYVTSTGQARIALDVGEDAVHFNTPELPHTRSEMALPLYYGGRLFGALDVQSTESNAFSQQDISALNVLADQISMAINNALLFQELQTSVEAERRAFSQANREAWLDYYRHAGRYQYKYANDQILQPDSQWPEDMVEALETQQIVKTDTNKPALSIPIISSGQTIGVIRVAKEAGQIPWSGDETDLIQTLADRISQALDSARLFQTTQQQAAQEQLTSEISSKFRQTLDIDAVLKTAAKELGSAFNAQEVVIRMAPNESND
ncbi:MAG TPA: GAF domain-containing protein [Anaerolineales bacterium]|nr:GAF domain-containing protein [Anaerolineales bacterium]